MTANVSGEVGLSLAVREALRDVYDPELGASVVDLNMVRRVDVIGDMAEIDLVLTVPECPLADVICEQARQAAVAIPGISGAVVSVLDEPWRPTGGGWRDWLADAEQEA